MRASARRPPPAVGSLRFASAGGRPNYRTTLRLLARAGAATAVCLTAASAKALARRDFGNNWPSSRTEAGQARIGLRGGGQERCGVSSQCGIVKTPGGSATKIACYKVGREDLGVRT